MRTTRTRILAVAAVLATTSVLAAQEKIQECSNVVVTVDKQNGPGDWSNNIAALKLQEQGQGWTIAMPLTQKGKHVQARKGESYRLNFGDGTHTVDVKPSTSGSGITVKAGSKPSIALVDISGGSGTQAVRFEITGSPNPNAKIQGCPGGSLYFDITG